MRLNLLFLRESLIYAIGGTPLPFQGVRRWLKGEALPSDDKLEVLADWLKVDKRYLRFGAGEKQVKTLTKPSILSQLTTEEIEILKVFLSLDARKRKVVAEVIKALAETY